MKYENEFKNFNESLLKRNRNQIQVDSKASMGNVLELDPLIKKRSELEGQLASIDEEINNLLNEIEKQKQHRVDVDNIIKQNIQWISDFDNKGDLYKIGHPSERKRYENNRDLYQTELDSTNNTINTLNEKFEKELTPKRNGIIDKLNKLVPDKNIPNNDVNQNADNQTNIPQQKPKTKLLIYGAVGLVGLFFIYKFIKK
jgi:hypothetical protein